MKLNVVLKNMPLKCENEKIEITIPSINVSLIDLRRAIRDKYERNFRSILNNYVGEPNNTNTMNKMKNDLTNHINENEKEIKQFILDYIFDNLEVNIL